MRAVVASTEQQAILETSSLAFEYNAALAVQVVAKYEQAERLEDRLENMIEQQGDRLRQVEARQPGILTLPRQRSRWQSQVQEQQSLLQRLHTRLESVRDIKEGMGVHASRIEELAMRKLRAEQPGLAEGWDDMCEAARRHQALMRKQEQERRKKLARGDEFEGTRQQGGSHVLGLSQVPR